MVMGPAHVTLMFGEITFEELLALFRLAHVVSKFSIPAQPAYHQYIISMHISHFNRYCLFNVRL